MRYLFGFLCVCALGVVPLVGCWTPNDPNVNPCEGRADGTECTISSGIFGSRGVCFAGDCRTDLCETVEDCDDGADCTEDACIPAGSEGVCDNATLTDGTPCAGGACQAGVCELTDTLLPCTEQGIRNAIAAGGDEPYTFDCKGPTTVASKAEIVIDNDVILDGEGNLTVDGDEKHRVFLVAATAELRGFVITNGSVSTDDDEDGGGIFNNRTLTLRNSTVSGNMARKGGGIASIGTLTLTNSTVSGNIADEGGGVWNAWSATLRLTNSTVSGNIADEGGGISSGRLRLTNSTVSGNIALSAVGSSATLTDSLVDGECTCGDVECDTIVTSSGYNIESPGDTCGFDQTGDQSGVTADELNLGELADNDGPTMTHALGLLPTRSVAIDHIPAVDCGVTTDQRGEPRPETGGTMCDVGAFERQPDDPEP